jgi:hypothetical protein
MDSLMYLSWPDIAIIFLVGLVFGMGIVWATIVFYMRQGSQP